MLRALAFAITLAFSGCHATPAFACQHPIPQERAAWAKAGFDVAELKAAVVARLIKAHLGESIAADQVFVLYKEGAPNVALVFASDGCATNLMILSVGEFNAIIHTEGA